MGEPGQARPSKSAGGSRSIVTASLFLSVGVGEVALAAFAEGAMLRVLWALVALTWLAGGAMWISTLRSRRHQD